MPFYCNAAMTTIMTTNKHRIGKTISLYLLLGTGKHRIGKTISLYLLLGPLSTDTLSTTELHTDLILT